MSELVYTARVGANAELAGDLWLLRLEVPTDLSGFRAGAFLHVQVDPGPFPLFRRAYSLLSATPGEAEILYKVAGVGTQLLSRRRPGDELSVVGPLGNTFTPPGEHDHTFLLAGGVGLPPIYRWAQNLLEQGVPAGRITFLYGARTERELVLTGRLESLGVEVRLATDDGSSGYHGRVTDLLRVMHSERSGSPSRYYACGPGPMLAACSGLTEEINIEGELALETPMPCGTGVCLGCIIPCRSASDESPVYRRTCVDGPIFPAREVLWPSI